jgi:hypothetical protein
MNYFARDTYQQSGVDRGRIDFEKIQKFDERMKLLRRVVFVFRKRSFAFVHGLQKILEVLKRRCLSAPPNLVRVYQQASGGGDGTAHLRVRNKFGKCQGQVFGGCGVGADAGLGCVVWAWAARRLASAVPKFDDDAPLCRTDA